LGYYISKCNEKDIIEKEYRQTFEELRDKRNALAHDIGYRDELVQNDEEAEDVRSIVEACCEWFDSRPSYPR
jgi:seryl-tRNA synthetase